MHLLITPMVLLYIKLQHLADKKIVQSCLTSEVLFFLLMHLVWSHSSEQGQTQQLPCRCTMFTATPTEVKC